MNKYTSSFLETSYDKAKNESLLWDEKKRVINFDSLANDICSLYREGENLSSVDALVETKSRRLFIEFKNQRLSRIDNRSIRKKAFDTICLFSLLNKRYGREEKKNTFIVVYRENDIPSWSRFKSKTLEYSNAIISHPILFGLEKYLTLYSDIWTMDVDAFFTSSLYKQIE
ncbi:MAG: hypothetical protein ACI4NI_01275 [Candidatus Ornithospirochaeta sp.]